MEAAVANAETSGSRSRPAAKTGTGIKDNEKVENKRSIRSAATEAHPTTSAPNSPITAREISKTKTPEKRITSSKSGKF